MQSLERIDRYRLERRLGSGAFGVVWLAHDDVLEAPVAVKVLAENWAHRLDVRERFLSEARLLRRAGSSRVVQVYDIGELPDGRPYFVMEYADGGTLADRITGSPLAVAEALRLTALAARSAAALHDAGIVHRDIKPSNVLLRTAHDGSTRLLLADLGLAKSLAQASGLTMAAGSAGYAAPEQSEPGSGIDARADVYSLGALGYHLLTGTVPARPGRVEPPTGFAPGCRPRSSGRSCGPWTSSASGAGRPPRPSRTRSTGLQTSPAPRRPSSAAADGRPSTRRRGNPAADGRRSTRAPSGPAAAVAPWSSLWPPWSSRVPPQPAPPCCCGSIRRRCEGPGLHRACARDRARVLGAPAARRRLEPGVTGPADRA